MKLKSSRLLSGAILVLSSALINLSVFAETDEERISRLSDNAEFYRLVKRVMPSYPEKALRYSRVGYVVVEYNINTNGEVVSPKVVDAMPEGIFNDAAVTAVKQWKYEPNFGSVAPDMALARARIRFAP